MLNVRFEVVVLLLSPLFVLRAHPDLSPRLKTVLAALLIGTTFATQFAWNTYRDRDRPG